MKENKQRAKALIKYINKAVTPYHAVAEAALMLKEAGFEELSLTERFYIKESKKYFMTLYGTALFAFTVGEDVHEAQSFHIAAAHTDYPCLHIKPQPELVTSGYMKLNVEVYGGAILNTWLDRPLSVAGRVALKSDDIYRPKTRLVDFKRPILTIPNLAVHMNREVNKGVELKPQNDMLPLLGMLSDKWNKDNYFLTMLAKELKVAPEEILDFDLFVYCAEEGSLVGYEEDMISCPRLDNLTSCHALLEALIAGGRPNGINLIALYDHEEIGSRTKQGADSALLRMVLERIYAALDMDMVNLDEAIMRSFLFSVDVAHALHPNHTDKYDPVHQVRFNEGVVFKINSSQRYTFDTEAIAIAQGICEKAEVKYKKFVNHSNVAGGGTLGPIISSWLPMKTVDIGVPIMAMHSARELMGVDDQTHLAKMMMTFFTE